MPAYVFIDVQVVLKHMWPCAVSSMTGEYHHALLL